MHRKLLDSVEMKILLTIFYFIIFSSALCAQRIDSTFSIEFIDSLLNMSRKFRDKGDLPQALSLALSAEEKTLQQFGKLSEIYARCCINRGKHCLAKSEHSEAEKWYREGMDILQRLLGTENNQYGKALSSLGVLYYWMGKYDLCEPIYLQVREIQEKAVGKNHIDYAVSINNLALLYKEQARFDKAEPYYLESYQLFKSILGPEHPQFAQSVNNLGVFYFTLGNYVKAEPLYLEAKAIREKVLGKDHPEYATSLTNLATFYSTLGNNRKSELYHKEALNIFRRTMGKKSLRYAQSLYNLAAEYFTSGNYINSINLLREAREILVSEFGKKHNDYINCTGLMSQVHKNMGAFDLADTLMQETLCWQDSLTGKNHPNYAISLIRQAKLFKDQNRNEESEELLYKALFILQKTVGIEYKEYANALLYLALIQERKHNYFASDSLWKIYSELNMSKLLKTVQFLSSEELNKHADALYKNSETMLSVLFDRAQNGITETDLIETIYDANLFQRGFVLSSASRLQLLTSITPESKELNFKLQALKRKLSKEYALASGQRNQKFIEDGEEKANLLEKELTQKVAGYSNSIKQIHCEDIQKKLKLNEAAIEFMKFTLDYPIKTDKVIYAALLLRSKDSQPIFIPLFEEKELKDLFNTNSKQQLSELYAHRGAKDVRNIQYKGLYDLVWKKMETYLDGISTLYFASTGLLHRINLSAIEVSKNYLLSDRFRMVQFGSMRQLVLEEPQMKKENQSILFGGITYNSLLNDSTQSRFTSEVTNEPNSFKWEFLPGTLSEVDSIAKLFTQYSKPVVRLKADQATELEFKNLSKVGLSPHILHIATHGYFFPKPETAFIADSTATLNNVVEKEPVFKSSNQPMLRTGLIFAGANASWSGNHNSQQVEDGILTALEISQLNLNNTELVVLSACETGLGDIEGNEGVFGLQRAFKIAGVKYIIMSLWQVPDKQTSMLMITFYKKWLEEKMSIPDAFHAAQKELRELGFDPYQWAGFVLVE